MYRPKFGLLLINVCRHSGNVVPSLKFILNIISFIIDFLVNFVGDKKCWSLKQKCSTELRGKVQRKKCCDKCFVKPVLLCRNRTHNAQKIYKLFVNSSEYCIFFLRTEEDVKLKTNVVFYLHPWIYFVERWGIIMWDFALFEADRMRLYTNRASIL